MEFLISFPFLLIIGLMYEAHISRKQAEERAATLRMETQNEIN